MENSNYVRISVCIATYNGKPYVKEQIYSILEQLTENDEIIISDDGSTDGTVEFIKSINDDRIIILPHEKVKNPWRNIGGDFKCFGVSSNFGNALKYARGQYIFLSDQDDIWVKDRISIILGHLQHKIKCCVICNYALMDKNGIIYKEKCRPNKTKFKIIKSVINPPFMGCLLAFDRSFYNHIYPFPKRIPSHDLWIGIYALLNKCLIVEDKPLHLYRTYGINVSSNIHNSLLFKIVYRIYIIVLVIYRTLINTLKIKKCKSVKIY